MSQIALASTASTSALDQLGQLAAARHDDAFWRTLASQTTPVTPAYEYSGYVLVVLLEFLQEAGVSIPLNTSHSATLAILHAQIDLLVCAASSDLAPLQASLASLQPAESELRAYFAEFTGDDWPESATALGAALQWLLQGIEQAQAHEQWLLVFVI